MSVPLTVLSTGSYRKFRCVQSDCEDTCCAGWEIVIDKPAYQKYKACQDADLRPKFESSLQLIEGSTQDIAYAQMNLSDNRCPFLTESSRCHIHEKLGENSLSRTCATYPRAVSLVDGVLECSLYLSCPEAARNVLLDPEAMRTEESARSQTFRFASPPTLNSHDRHYSDKPYEAFPALRQLIHSIIVDRTFAVWERLLIVGLLCEQIDQAIASGQASITGQIIESYARQLEGGMFAGAFKGVPRQPEVQIDFVMKWAQARIDEGSCPPRFVQVFSEFLRGAGSNDTSMSRAREYSLTVDHWYQPFAQANEHIMENFLLNYAMRTLFPFGPQKSLYRQPRGVFEAYTLLIVHYALVHGLLVGVAAGRREEFDAGDVVRVVQSFAKAIEHNLPFLNRIVAFLDNRNLSTMVYLAALIRD